MTGRFEPDALLAEARQRTGLADFGPDDFLEPFRVFAGSLEPEADLAPDRADAARERVLRLLVNRLWFARDLAEHPEIGDEDIGTPVVITSLPRTGSTKLHRLLAASGDFNTLDFQQVHMPSRIPGLPDGGMTNGWAERRSLTLAYQEWMYGVSPGILAGHPMFVDEAEECQWLMEQSFAYPTLYGLFEVPSYLGWLMRNGTAQAYDYFRTQLQYLQWQRGGANGRPWLLKSPTHFGMEGELDRVFGAIVPIVTHRDPADFIPSITATSNAARTMYSDRRAGDGLLEALCSMFAGAASAHMAWRERSGAGVLDLPFSLVSRDSTVAIGRVYEFLGISLRAEAMAAMRDWEADETRNRHARATYSADEHGASPETIRAAFADYMETFASCL